VSKRHEGASGRLATKIHRVFDIVRRNDKIGTATIDIERQNDTTTIKIKKDVSVKDVHRGLSLRTFLQRNLEKRQLVAFKSRTNDNGTKHSIDGCAGQAEHGRRRQA
jgi:uncharacterized protein DUF6134